MFTRVRLISDDISLYFNGSLDDQSHILSELGFNGDLMVINGD